MGKHECIVICKLRLHPHSADGFFRVSYKVFHKKQASMYKKVFCTLTIFQQLINHFKLLHYPTNNFPLPASKTKLFQHAVLHHHHGIHCLPHLRRRYLAHLRRRLLRNSFLLHRHPREYMLQPWNQCIQHSLHLACQQVTLTFPFSVSHLPTTAI